MVVSVRHCPFHVIGEKTKTQIDCIIGLHPQNSQWGLMLLSVHLKITTDNCSCPLFINLSTYVSIPQTPLPCPRLLYPRII